MKKNRRTKKQRTLKDIFLPHVGNNFKPLLFAASTVVFVLMVAVLLEAGYLFHTRVLSLNSNFLASVLPGVLVGLTNEDRASKNIPALTPDEQLAKAAQLKAEDMAARGYFSHVSPDGKTPWYWFDQVGYKYTYAGENLAVNFTDSKDVQTAWMASPTHHANIMKPQYTRIGIGVAEGMYEGKKTTFVVQEFATPAPAQLALEKARMNAAGPTASTSKVLGAETGPETSSERLEAFLSAIVTSPFHMSIYIFGGAALVFLVFLVIAIVVHARVQYIEIIGGGILILVVLVGLMVYNATSASLPDVPETGNAATVGGLL